jgi:lysozyme family protein
MNQKHSQMAKVELLAPKILRWEGGFVNDPVDHGGATNKGVTLSTWTQVGYDKNGDGDIDVDDIRLLTQQDATIVLKKFYWDRWKADGINNQSIADILVDWVWCSGKWGVVIPQRVLNVTADGIVGTVTLKALNSANQQKFFEAIVTERTKFIYNIISHNPSQKRFLNGWMNRLNDFKFRET